MHIGLHDKDTMNNLLILIPIALGLGIAGLLTFVWSLKSGQFDDLDGAAERILEEDPLETPASQLKDVGIWGTVLGGTVFESPRHA